MTRNENSSYRGLPQDTSSSARFAPGFRFRLIHVLYVMALLSASLATFGAIGLIPFSLFSAFWSYVFWRYSRPRGLLEAFLILFVFGFCVLLMLPAVSNAREAARRMQCSNNLKQIALALHNYHDTHKSFPPAYIADENGRPMHSWRVLILPFLESSPLHRQYRFDEPWDGPNNRRLAAFVPPPYQCPSQVYADGSRTSYLAVVGPRTAWPDAAGSRLKDFVDGTPNTIMVIEADPYEVNWMEPRDLSYQQAVDLMSRVDFDRDGHVYEDFFWRHTPVRGTVLADGSVQFIPDGLDRDVAQSLLCVNDGFPTHDTNLYNLPGPPRQLNIGNCVRLGVFLLLLLWPLPWVWINPRPHLPKGSFRWELLTD